MDLAFFGLLLGALAALIIYLAVDAFVEAVPGRRFFAFILAALGVSGAAVAANLLYSALVAKVPPYLERALIIVGLLAETPNLLRGGDGDGDDGDGDGNGDDGDLGF